MKENIEIGNWINDILGVSTGGEKYLTFQVLDEYYAISILKVKEIIGMSKITKIPNLPNYIKGVINLRGEIVHLIDIREKFGIEKKEYNKFTVIIIVETSNNLVGFIVDKVLDVINIEKDKIQKVIEIEGMIGNEYLKGMIKELDELIVIIDIEKLIMG
ncbi:MAG: hypothetical protein B6I28_01115 [Fusobacteriia bacterium 4572_132]|nr:MAG: hypothetical protein B6I28_01115 [Fusobacteriia bacterium 4572_132]